LPAIYRAAVAKSGNSIVTDTPYAQVLLPVPGRSRASALLRLRQNQKQSCKLILILLLLFLPRKSRRHKMRLGCRLNAGGVEWAERHGCRESRPRPWMADGGGPTERRRSEGTTTKESPNREQTLGYWGFSSNPPKAERFCR
jgi:hypothetical protein